MGNWVIVIEGTGSHHNSGAPGDADVLAAEFTAKLQAAGQHVTHATITSGGRQNCMPPIG